MHYLAIDYWTRKSWLAINFENVSMPLKIVKTHELINEIKVIISERKIDKLILWMANHVDWRISDHSKKIIAFAKVLKWIIPKDMEIIFHDERFSSFEAAKTLELAWEKKFDPKNLDDIAACIILESYLNTIN